MTALLRLAPVPHPFDGLRLILKVAKSDSLLAREQRDVIVRHAHFNGITDEGDPAHRIALVGDTVEMGMSHDYVALLARQQGITLRNFQNEPQAIEWVRDRRQPEERRHQSEQTAGAPLERRQNQRRKPPADGSPDPTPA